VPRKKGYYAGLGDLVAALLLAWGNRSSCRPSPANRSPATLTPNSLETILRNTLGTTQAVIQRTIATPSKEILLVQSKLDIERPPTQDFSITCRPLP
jgi:pyridoxal/pyridoxine/pyridoxamine kinase